AFRPDTIALWRTCLRTPPGRVAFSQAQKRGQARSKPAAARTQFALTRSHHRLQIIIRLDDLDQPILGRAVAAVCVGMMLLYQRLVFQLDFLKRRVGTEPHHLQGFPLCVEDFSRFSLRLSAGTGAPAAAAVELAEQAERIGGTVEIGGGGVLAFAASAVGPHAPSGAMAGQRILLIARDRLGVHARKEIVGLVVLTNVI